ncbi:Fc.00g008070.m01.CDS01 [Cosmosporella sp. VM-42]
MATNNQPVVHMNHEEMPALHDDPPSAPTTTTGATILSISPSESSDDGIRLSPAAARRFARRNLRRSSPTPDLVTSLVRPPSPDTLYIGAQVSQQNRQDSRNRLGPEALYSSGVALPNANPERRSGPLLSPHASSLDIPRRYGGNCIFDMYSLAYVTEPDANLHCPICHDPLVDPVTTPCDHTFCYRCLRSSLDTSPSGSVCPIDRDPLIWPNCFSAARLIRTQLNSLIVKCPNHTRGCKKEMRREAIEKHATTECKFKDYPCPGPNCEKTLRSKPTGETCTHREVRCNHCQAGVLSADRELHLLSCPMSKTRCESCWQMVYRNQVSAHLELECEGIVVLCTYQEFGCPARLTRGQLNAHTMGCGFHPETPSGMIIRSQRELIASYEDMGAQIHHLHARQDETTRRINELVAAVGRRGSGDAIFNDSRTLHDLDAGFEEVHQNLTHLEARQSMWTMNQIMPLREEITELRNSLNMLRMHVNWRLNRSLEEGRNRATNNSGSSTTIRREDVLPERRRSSSAEAADLPRL